MALSDDLRKRVVEAVVLGGLSRNAAARRFGVSIASAVRWVTRYKTTAQISPSPSPVGAERHRSGHVEAVDDLARAADADPVARVDSDQRVTDEDEAFAHRDADMVGEFERRRAGAALHAVDDDEVGIDSGLDHRLAD